MVKEKIPPVYGGIKGGNDIDRICFYLLLILFQRRSLEQEKCHCDRSEAIYKNIFTIAFSLPKLKTFFASPLEKCASTQLDWSQFTTHRGAYDFLYIP